MVDGSIIYIQFFFSVSQLFHEKMSSSESESWSRLIQRVVRTKNQEKNNNNVTYSQKGLKKTVRKLEAINAQFEGVDSEFREKAAILDFDIVRYSSCIISLLVYHLRFVTIKSDVTEGKNLNIVGGLRTNWIEGRPGVYPKILLSILLCSTIDDNIIM